MIQRTTDPQLGIRLPYELKERLRDSAERNRRSMNSEIIVLLEKALPAKAEAKEGEAA